MSHVWTKGGGAAAVLFALAALLGQGVEPVRAADAPPASKGLKVTVYQVWASPKPGGKVPKELEEFVDQLKKRSGKQSFRLEGKPVARTLRGAATIEMDLPQGYKTKISLASNGGSKTVLRQVLVNPKKVEAVDLLKRSPAFTHLERIRQGDETFLLIVKFQAEA